MAHDDKRRPSAPDSKPGLKAEDGKTGKAIDSVRQRAKASAERPFDMWLQKQLHAMYDEIASEPLPNDLLNLIDRDAATGDGGTDDSGKTGKKP
jgi:hypothetical protein